MTLRFTALAVLVTVVNGQLWSSFDYTGDDQLYTVPDGVTALNVYMWGAGGGGWQNSGSGQESPDCGGAGAMVQGTLDVTPGETLTIITGCGGTISPATSYGGGGGGQVVGGGTAGAGGGRSAIQRDGVDIVTAGGGGGRGWESWYGGDGGLETGEDGWCSDGQACGGGGTQTAGGAAGIGDCYGGCMTAGEQYLGGTGVGLGGGGGGGWYGGGGAPQSGQASGGGGSSLTSNLRPFEGTDVVGFVSPGPEQPANGDSIWWGVDAYGNGIGVGGNSNTANAQEPSGGMGRVVIQLGDIDCAGEWTCTAACEAGADRVWLETAGQAGTGAACPIEPPADAEDCAPGEDQCLPGCMDEGATNYDAAATSDDGSCVCDGFRQMQHNRAVCSSCNGDMDGNDKVNVYDIMALLGDFGLCDPRLISDGNNDGCVGIQDLLLLLPHFGKDCSARWVLESLCGYRLPSNCNSCNAVCEAEGLACSDPSTWPFCSDDDCSFDRVRSAFEEADPDYRDLLYHETDGFFGYDGGGFPIVYATRLYYSNSPDDYTQDAGMPAREQTGCTQSHPWKRRLCRCAGN
jgi:hypothetical protein